MEVSKDHARKWEASVSYTSNMRGRPVVSVKKRRMGLIASREYEGLKVRGNREANSMKGQVMVLWCRVGVMVEGMCVGGETKASTRLWGMRRGVSSRSG